MRGLIAAGADGIISNYPARLRQVVDSAVDNATV
jgi:glycerophosphoryl diester phosphodiesterase